MTTTPNTSSSASVSWMRMELATISRFAEDDSFSARLSPGRYEVQVNASGDLIPRSIRAEDTEVMQDGLTISHSGKLPLEIALAHDGATIDGVVANKDDQPVPGATVVLIPETK